jgi:hypothetical protein
MITSASGISYRIIRVAAIPSILGMEMSMSTRSGRIDLVFSTASNPSDASPEIIHSEEDSSVRQAAPNGVVIINNKEFSKDSPRYPPLALRQSQAWTDGPSERKSALTSGLHVMREESEQSFS